MGKKRGQHEIVMHLTPSKRWLVPLPKIRIVKSVIVKGEEGGEREGEIKQKISPRMSNGN